jgi:hypothetical protein
MKLLTVESGANDILASWIAANPMIAILAGAFALAMFLKA